MSSYNLIDEQWVKVLDRNGRVSKLSLHEILLQAGAIRELAENSPLVNIAVLRLLLAVVHAAAWGEDDVEDKREKWSNWWKTGRCH